LTVAQLAALPSLGQKSAQNLIAAIDRARTAEVSRFINALSIPMVGDAISRILAARFKTLADLIAALKAVKEPFQKASANLDEAKELSKKATKNFGETARQDRLLAKESRRKAATLDQEVKKLGFGEVGPKTLAKMIYFFEDPNNQEFVADLLNPSLARPTVIQTTIQPLTGLKFCLTGSLSEPRATVVKKLTAQGALVAPSVGAKVDFLVVGAKTGQTKLGAAQKTKTKIVAESQFQRLMTDDFLQSLENLADREAKLARIVEFLAS
jgi:DNA ligase (NAD+)